VWAAHQRRHNAAIPVTSIGYAGLAGLQLHIRIAIENIQVGSSRALTSYLLCTRKRAVVIFRPRGFSGMYTKPEVMHLFLKDNITGAESISRGQETSWSTLNDSLPYHARGGTNEYVF
jgi:hypothetical protein